MKPEERARHASRGAGCGRPLSTEDVEVLREFIEEQIIAAIEEEREACAGVADAWNWPGAPDKPDSNLASHVARKIARKIRERGERR